MNLRVKILLALEVDVWRKENTFALFVFFCKYKRSWKMKPPPALIVMQPHTVAWLSCCIIKWAICPLVGLKVSQWQI